MKKLLIGLLAYCLLGLPVAQSDTAVREDHPQVYTVVEGDTLWDIASRFLRDPWRWSELWKANEQIQNPDLIFPGDKIRLVYVDGEPRLSVERGGDVKLGPRDVRLRPSVRSVPIDQAIPAIPLEDINAFLSRSRVVASDELDSSPYVIAGEGGHVVTGAGDRLFARGKFPSDERIFGVFRPGQVFVDPDSGDVLGLQAVDIGRGKLLGVEGDIGTLDVIGSREEIRRGDRLLPYVEQRISATFFPSVPEQDVRGVIIDVEGGVTQVGKYDIVAVNLGERHGIVDGNVLAIDKVGEVVTDPITNKLVKVPDTRAGLLMVFRTFDRISFGLVLHASQSLKVMDAVYRP